MTLAGFFNLLVSRWKLIAALTVLGALAMLAYSLLQTPMYAARAQVFVSTRTSDTAGDILAGANFTLRQVRSYTELVTSPSVLQPVIDELGLSESRAQLARRVESDSPIDTVLINLRVTDASPQRAATIANTIAESLANVVQRIEAPLGDGESPVRLSTVRAAEPPATPSSPRPGFNTIRGLVGGLTFGAGLAVLIGLLDTRVRDAAAVGKLTDAPVLGTIGFDPEAVDAPIVLQVAPDSMRAESIRRIRTSLKFVVFDSHSDVLLITSSIPGEGKSTTSINLAIVLAQAGKRVLLIDADLRRPSVAEYLQLEPAVGLTTLLVGEAEIDDVLQPWGNGNLDVITSGAIPPNPSELLESTKMLELLEELTGRYDMVFIDSAPLLPVTDGAVLAAAVGGAIIVVGADMVHRKQLLQSFETLDQVGARALGVVVNRVPPGGAGNRYHSYYGYGTRGAAPEASRVSRRSLPG